MKGEGTRLWPNVLFLQYLSTFERIIEEWFPQLQTSNIEPSALSGTGAYFQVSEKERGTPALIPHHQYDVFAQNYAVSHFFLVCQCFRVHKYQYKKNTANCGRNGKYLEGRFFLRPGAPNLSKWDKKF